jgi:hypothetical protein
VPIVLKSGSLNLLEPSGPVQACNGIALPFLLLPPGDNPSAVNKYIISNVIFKGLFSRFHGPGQVFESSQLNKWQLGRIFSEYFVTAMPIKYLSGS